MALSTLAQPKSGVKSSGLSGIAGISPVSKKADTTTVVGLARLAQQSGLGKEAEEITDPTSKLSVLQRLGKGLGAFNPAEAYLTGIEKGTLAGLAKYPVSIFKGVGSAITGKDIEGERRGFRDVAEKYGIENGILKFGLGFLGDVFLDPSTYFGGALVKGVLKSTQLATKGGLSIVGKIAPEAEQGIKLIGTGLQDALGRAFQYGYKATQGAREDILTFMSKSQKAKLGLAASNLDRLGTGILTPAQREE
jgi:hypothetical protein